MAQTKEQLVSVFNNEVQSINPNIVTGLDGTGEYITANATAQVVTSVSQDSIQLLNNAFAASSAGTFLDKHGAELQLIRQGALPSTGIAALTNIGAATTTITIPAGTLLTSATTGNQYYTLADVTVTTTQVFTTVQLMINSVILGLGTASPNGDVLTFNTPILDGSISLIAAVAGDMALGSPIENDNQLSNRIFHFSQQPRGGGSLGDYELWGFLGDPSITGSYCVPAGGVANSNLIYIIILIGASDPNYYIDPPIAVNRAASTLNINNVQAYIETYRPVNDDPNVITTTTFMVNSAVGVITLYVALSSGLTIATFITDVNGTSITVGDIIFRELRRALISTPPGGKSVIIGGTVNQYIIVSDLELGVLTSLGNSGTFQGTYASILTSVRVNFIPTGQTSPISYISVPSLATGNLITEGPPSTAAFIYDLDSTAVNVVVE
jgi:hypothetical protein